MTRNLEAIGKWFENEQEFNQLFPLTAQKHDARHWSSLKVARKAAEYLCDGFPVRILDIGSGTGKFCLAGAYFQPQAFFFGIEQRANLTEIGEKAKNILHLENVEFQTGNFTEVDFSLYDHFYFFNSFFENLTGTEKIDECIIHSSALYDQYNLFLHEQLDARPPGTKLVTFHSLEDEVPESYFVVDTDMKGQLKFWVKV